MPDFTWTEVGFGNTADPNQINDLGNQVEYLTNPQRASVAITTGGPSVGTSDTEVMRISGFTFQTGRAYRCSLLGGASSAGGNEVLFSLYKNSTAGTRFTEFYRYPMSTLVRNCDGTRYLKNVSGVDVTCDVLLTQASSSSTSNAFATTQTPFALTIEECGNAADYGFANTV
jgi:hypothetical protein